MTNSDEEALKKSDQTIDNNLLKSEVIKEQSENVDNSPSNEAKNCSIANASCDEIIDLQEDLQKSDQASSNNVHDAAKEDHSPIQVADDKEPTGVVKGILNNGAEKIAAKRQASENVELNIPVEKPIPIIDVLCTGPQNMQQMQFIVNNVDTYLKSDRSQFLEQSLISLLEFTEKKKIRTAGYTLIFDDETWKELEYRALSMKKYEMDLTLLKKFKQENEPFKVTEDKGAKVILHKYFKENNPDSYAGRSAPDGSCLLNRKVYLKSWTQNKNFQTFDLKSLPSGKERFFYPARLNISSKWQFLTFS